MEGWTRLNLNNITSEMIKSALPTIQVFHFHHIEGAEEIVHY